MKKIIKKQAVINIGVIGHVAHGKSTIVHSITGVQTIKFKKEFERNITIKLGYANAKIFKCKNIQCPRPGCFASTKSIVINYLFCNQCHYEMQLVRHVSFVDCPGHEILMATMLSGASIMDASLVVIAANEMCPQPQTAEHMISIKIMKLDKIITIQNKIDLVSKKDAIESYQKIKTFIRKADVKNFPIIPISIKKKCNIDVLLQKIIYHIPLPIRNFKDVPIVSLIRSFDVNKPGSIFKNIRGGIVGGVVLSGILCIKDKIEICPGITSKKKNHQVSFFPLRSMIMSLNTEENNLKYAVPGGLIGIGLNVSPDFSRADRLIGQLLGYRNLLPEVYISITIKYKLFRRLLGITDKNFSVSSLYSNEVLMINIGSSSAGGKILYTKKNTALIKLTIPLCFKKDYKITLSRRIHKHWRLIGWGKLIRGKKI
nr:eukaryotic translation initiation factor gamma SU [Cryptomonas paramecium]